MGKQIIFKFETLTFVLSKIFNTKIIYADWQAKSLQGGTVADVNLITGTAETANGDRLSYDVVLKIKQFEKCDGSETWRKEYDFYNSNFNSAFSGSFRCPDCYHAEINSNEIQLWLEYIKGTSGTNLTLEMFECAATELGRFQGKLYEQKPAVLQNSSHFSTYINSMKDDYSQWKPETDEYCFIRSDDCPIPVHLRKMLIDVDNNVEIMFENLKKLPLVFCHGDFWSENIFYSNDSFTIIDWEGAGLGFLGEDIAALIGDVDTNIERMHDYYLRFIPAYYKSISEYMDISAIKDYCIRDMILLKFGYRFVNRYMFRFKESPDKQKQQINALQKIYEMKDIILRTE